MASLQCSSCHRYAKEAKTCNGTTAKKEESSMEAQPFSYIKKNIWEI